MDGVIICVSGRGNGKFAYAETTFIYPDLDAAALDVIPALLPLRTSSFPKTKIMADQGAETKPKVENGSVINLVVKDQNDTEVHFKVKTHTKFQKIMEAYASKRSVDVAAIRFLYDGQRLDKNSTPGDHSMEDNDVIDCVLEQIGGQ
ncbi:hypothetical protein WJX75_008008 [Coccomyxa subellipsoidea]|uniref:Ubiquitin-like domain-containing protein n=1 Tax=Coccomyxa subellipsoidea TaxID=248742 RepID=A0ABR2Z3Z3_9CHLO